MNCTEKVLKKHNTLCKCFKCLMIIIFCFVSRFVLAFQLNLHDTCVLLLMQPCSGFVDSALGRNKCGQMFMYTCSRSTQTGNNQPDTI